MRDIRRNTWAALDIVQRKLAHPRVELQEEGQRLPDTTRGTQNSNLSSL